MKYTLDTLKLMKISSKKPLDKNSRVHVRYLNEKNMSLLMVRRERIRTKIELIDEVKKLALFDKKFLNYTYLRKAKRHDLLYEAVIKFGGWRNAVQAVGYKPIQKSWNREEIITTIKKIGVELGRVPKSKEVVALGYSGLPNAVTRRFGDWTSALIAAGLKPHRQNITKEDSIIRLQAIANQLGHSPSMRELKQLNDQPLLDAGLKYFGTYNNFLIASNLQIVLAMNKWPKEKIINELKSVAKTFGRSPTRTELASMKRYDLINAVEKNLCSWSNGLVMAGLTPNKDALNDDTTWRAWENLIFDILNQRKIDFVKHKYIKRVGYPDVYIPSQEKIIEIKMNCSDNSVKKDIEKYLPYCKKLEIWYLYGHHFGILSNKVCFVGPQHIRQIIKDTELIERFNQIRWREIQVHKKPRKVLVLGSGAHYTEQV